MGNSICRIVALPPMTEQKEAVEILQNFCGHNTDGIGSVYVKNKKFVVNKWPRSLYKVLAANQPLLDHLPHKGWTLVHLRAASHGCNARRNTHPFIVGDRAVIHNGVWSEYAVAYPLISMHRQIHGETDTEVAAHYLDMLGLDVFLQSVDRGGVFMSLNRDGSLDIVKTSGDLCMNKVGEDGVYLIASELDAKKYPKQKDTVDAGWIRFDARGKYIQHYKKDDDVMLEGEKPNKVEKDIKKFLEKPILSYTKYQYFGGPTSGGTITNHSPYGHPYSPRGHHAWVPSVAGAHIGEGID